MRIGMTAFVTVLGLMLAAPASAGFILTVDFELTVVLDEGMGEQCGTQSALRVSPGDRVYLCYSVENTGNVSYTTHDLVDDQLGTLLSGFSFNLAPGGSVFLTQNVEITAPVTHTAQWTASGPGVSAMDMDSLAISIGTPDIELDITVAPSSGDADIDGGLCGTEDSITVPSGSRVVFCYSVMNSGEVRLDTHDLVDDFLGTILAGFAFSLEPGASVFLTQTVPITADQQNTATWTATNSVNVAFSAVAMNTAIVTVPEPSASAAGLTCLLCLALVALRRSQDEPFTVGEPM